MNADFEQDEPDQSLGPKDRFEELLAQLVESGLSAAMYAELAALLHDSPARRRKYVRWMALHVQLQNRGEVRTLGAAGVQQTGVSVAANEHFESPVLQPSAHGGSAELAAGLQSSGPKSPVLGFLGNVISNVSQSRSFMFWLICGGLSFYFAVQFGSLVLNRFWAQNVPQLTAQNEAGIEGHGEPGHRPAAATGTIVARLTNSIDCQWRVASSSSLRPSAFSLQSLAIGSELRAGQRLNLDSGLAELTFTSGAKIILHGPARFDVTDALGGDLEIGKLAAKVPHAAAGFTIGTPTGRVVDLGTEFGVKVLADRTANIVVYVGEVEVNSSSSGNTDSVNSAPHKGVHVKAGEAVTVGPDKTVKPIAAENERFVRDLTPLGKQQDSEAAYVDFVKRLKPVVWLRMEGRPNDRVLHNEVGRGDAGEVRRADAGQVVDADAANNDAKLFWDGPGNPFAKGRIGKGLWLRGEKLKDCAILPDYPKAEHGKLTVAAWVYAESRSNFASIAKNWHHGDGLGQFHFGLVSKFNPNDGSYHPDGEDLGAEVAQADGTTVTAREGEAKLFPVNQWQHVAFVVDGENLRLYRQGREVAATKCAGLKYPVGLKSLGIGAKTDETGAAADFAYPGYWTGKLDEITVFNDAISADDIQKLSAAAPR